MQITTLYDVSLSGYSQLQKIPVYLFWARIRGYSLGHDGEKSLYSGLYNVRTLILYYM